MKKRMVLVGMLIMSMTLPLAAEEMQEMPGSIESTGGDQGYDAGGAGDSGSDWDEGWNEGSDQGASDEGSFDQGASDEGDYEVGQGGAGSIDAEAGNGSQSGPSAGDIVQDSSGHHWYYDGTQYLPMDGSVEIPGVELPGGSQSGPQQPQAPSQPAPPSAPEGMTDAEADQMRIIEVRGDQFEMHPAGADCEETIEAVSVCLRELTDLDFAFDYKQVEEGLVVSWKEESIVTAGLGDTTPESLGFESEQQVQWFMLDSLQATLRYNFGYANIWYTDAAGENLTLLMSEDLPCLGGGFYVTYAEAAEDAENVVVEKVEGKEQAELVLKIYVGEMLIRDAQISFKEEGMVGDAKAYIFHAGGEDLAVTETGLICEKKEGSDVFTPIAPEMQEEAKNEA